MVAADPHQGGATWAVLQYVLGLQRLGHRVLLVEPIPSEKVRPRGSPLGRSENAAYFREVVDAFGLEGAAALLLSGTHRTTGIPYRELEARARRTDVLINIGGMLQDDALVGTIPARVYLDLDPAFTQLWQAQGIDMRLDGHTSWFTVGPAVADGRSGLPDCGAPWTATVPPVVLDLWPAAETIELDALTTIANWRGYGSIEHEGTFYGQKAHSLRPLMALPARTGARFVLGLAIDSGEADDLAALAMNGWELVDPVDAAGTPTAYQTFVRGSRAEFGLTKGGYVVSRCGWFSDRSACYLASGRPVIAQDTGFERYLPTGEGLFAFTSAEEVAAAIEELSRDYRRHAVAARDIAVEHFDSDTVLSKLLESVP